MMHVETPKDTPCGNLAGFVKYARFDIASGFLVFLIALPLCLGISLASGYPAIAGVFTAIVGSVLTALLSNSELTIKGPAAGLIVIVVGAVTSFGYTGGQDKAADLQAYKMALAVGVVAGVIQIGFGMLRAGVLGDFFPTSAVHGMLAAIGVIIMLKQIPEMVGQKAKGEPLEILRQLPDKIANMNPKIAFIGSLSLLILFSFPFLKARFKLLKVIPSQLVVLVVAIPLGIFFDLSQEHSFSMADPKIQVREQYLVAVPNNLFGAIAHPDFSVFTKSDTRGAAIKWVVMFALIGSLESMLSAKAVDMIDPWKRKTGLNRDLIAVGIANTVASAIGGLPMISEIVRSKANIDNGARTRFANLWHGVFLLGFVALLPWLIHRIPLAALAAMLVYTGARLASPYEFINVYKIGREQLLIFVSTIIAVLATDLLIGIGIGICVKLAIHTLNGVPLTFRTYLEVEPRGENTVQINARGSAVFTNWITFKRQLEYLGLEKRNHLIVNLAGTKLVDHSVMEGLHELESNFALEGLKFETIGLEGHQRLSEHPYAARVRAMTRLRRVTIVAEADLESTLAAKLVEFGATGYTCIPCSGVGRKGLTDGSKARSVQTRLETVVPPTVADRILDYIRMDVSPTHPVTACVETVEVLRRDQFQ